MKILSLEEFKNKKHSDTIVIYGSGYSINDLTLEEKLKLSEFDSIGFNWFCKSHIPTTFYLIREQTTPSKGGFRGEMSQDLLSDLTKFYTNSCLIVVDMKFSSNAWRGKRGWTNHLNKLLFEGVIVHEKYYPQYKEQVYINFFENTKKIDIFKDHIMYATCSMSNILHITNWLNYERFIFVGVDLYDHRYFWLAENVLRERTRKSKRDLDKQHFTATVTVKMISDFLKVFPNKKLYVYNPKSLLKDVIPVWKV